MTCLYNPCHDKLKQTAHAFTHDFSHGIKRVVTQGRCLPTPTVAEKQTNKSQRGTASPGLRIYRYTLKHIWVETLILRVFIKTHFQ